MNNVLEAPEGQGRTPRSCADIFVPDGWRKATATLRHADTLAAQGAAQQADRTRCIVAVKRVAARIGLKAADILLLDTLAAFTKPQDWAAGQRPIVWASNAYLMAQTGFSLSTLKRHARKLIDHGIMTCCDSPNGKRWGHRDASGRIVEAYGFDLSPLAARVEEFAALATHIQEERQHLLRTKRQVTIARRLARSRISALEDCEATDKTDALWSAYADLVQHLPKATSGVEEWEKTLHQFRAFLAELETETSLSEGSDSTNANKVSKDTDVIELTPMGPEIDPHIPIQKNLKSVVTDGDKNGEPCKKDVSRHKENTAQEPVSFLSVRDVCPEFSSWTNAMGHMPLNWNDAQRSAGALGPMIGIRPQTWTDALSELGTTQATAALMLIFDKHSAGEVSAPNGYLRGMIRKAQRGELHLTRSFVSRARRQAA